MNLAPPGVATKHPVHAVHLGCEACARRAVWLGSDPQPKDGFRRSMRSGLISSPWLKMPQARRSTRGRREDIATGGAECHPTDIPCLCVARHDVIPVAPRRPSGCIHGALGGVDVGPGIRRRVSDLALDGIMSSGLLPQPYDNPPISPL